MNPPTHLHLGNFAYTFNQSDVQPFIHTPTAQSTTQGDSQLVGIIHSQASFSGTPRHLDSWSLGSNDELSSYKSTRSTT